MRTAKSIVLLVGAILFVLSALFPPWVHEFKWGVRQGAQPLGYAFLSRPPTPRFLLPPMEAKQALNQNFDPDKASWNDLPVADGPAPERDPIAYASGGNTIRIDFSRLALEWVAIAGLLGIAWILARKRPA